MPIDPADIQLSPEQKAFIAAEAERTGTAWTRLLEQWLPASDDRKISAGTSALEAAEQLGLVGGCDGGPGDLATNPVHLEGFGRDALGQNAS